jgi:hypothetical protein
VADADRRFRFAQFEFPWVLGPDDGRYLIRDPASREPRHILVLNTLGARERRLLGRDRRTRDAPPEPDPEPVTTTRATVIDAQPLSERDAEAWLSGMDREARGQVLGGALQVLNETLRTQRVVTGDPSVRDVTREQAIVVRIGHATGEQAADGRWSEAIEVPMDRGRRQRRVAALRPQERLAAVLGGQDAVLACEELTLRARADLNAGRDREAALQLRVALEAGIAELEPLRHPGDMPERVSELREQRPAVGAAANEALLGQLPDGTRAAMEHALGRLEAALRARSAAGPPPP